MNPDMQALSCFDEKLKTRFSSRWGNRSAEWMDFYDPHVDFPVFSADTGKAILEVYADSLLLHTESIHLYSGLGYYQYHLTMDESAIEELIHFIKSKDSKSDPKVAKRDNEKYYLPPGKYIIKVRKNGLDCSLNLEVK